MATYRGGEVPDYEPTDVSGPPLPGMENVEEELNLWPEAGTDRTRRPGEKGYMKEQHIAQQQQPRQINPLPPAGSDADARRKLGNRLNINEINQTREDQRMGGFGTSRDLMPAPPQTRSYEGGGPVCKYGSDTVVSCKYKNQ